MVQDVGGLQIFIHRSEKIMPFDRNQFEIFRDRKSIKLLQVTKNSAAPKSSSVLNGVPLLRQ